MNQAFALLILFIAAVLEAGGDALVRLGLTSTSLNKRVEFMVLGAVVLLSYGIVVNLPRWDFGQVLGIYIAFFFGVAQLINFFVFNQKPGMPVLVGGALIMTGGLVIALWRG